MFEFLCKWGLHRWSKWIHLYTFKGTSNRFQVRRCIGCNKEEERVVKN